MNNCNNICDKSDEQSHVHEVTGSVRLAELKDDPHNHRFAGVTGEAISVPRGHIHKLCTKTDFYEEHFHLIEVTTGLQIPVGDGRHVHFIDSDTEIADEHFHEFITSTQIENPIGE